MVNGVQTISFERLKMGGHGLVWWEIHLESLKHDNQPPITPWDAFKNLLID